MIRLFFSVSVMYFYFLISSTGIFIIRLLDVIPCNYRLIIGHYCCSRPNYAMIRLKHFPICQSRGFTPRTNNLLLASRKVQNYSVTNRQISYQVIQFRIRGEQRLFGSHLQNKMLLKCIACKTFSLSFIGHWV